jgi:hypothetical protein
VPGFRSHPGNATHSTTHASTCPRPGTTLSECATSDSDEFTRERHTGTGGKFINVARGGLGSLREAYRCRL